MTETRRIIIIVFKIEMDIILRDDLSVLFIYIYICLFIVKRLRKETICNYTHTIVILTSARIFNYVYNNRENNRVTQLEKSSYVFIHSQDTFK